MKPDLNLSNLDYNELFERFIIEFSSLDLGLALYTDPKWAGYKLFDKRGSYGTSNLYEPSEYATFINELISKIKKKLPLIGSSDLKSDYSKLQALDNRYTKAGELLRSFTKGLPVLEYPNINNGRVRNRERFPDFNTKDFLLQLFNIFSIPELNGYGVEATHANEFENDVNFIWILVDFIEFHTPKLRELTKVYQTEIDNKAPDVQTHISKTKKLPQNADLNISLKDVLKPEITPETVKEMYFDHFSKYPEVEYSLKFLRHLMQKGYFKRKISWDETFFLVNNEFHIHCSNSNRNYNPPHFNSPEYKEDPWRKIPER